MYFTYVVVAVSCAIISLSQTDGASIDFNLKKIPTVNTVLVTEKTFKDFLNNSSRCDRKNCSHTSGTYARSVSVQTQKKPAFEVRFVPYQLKRKSTTTSQPNHELKNILAASKNSNANVYTTHSSSSHPVSTHSTPHTESNKLDNKAKFDKSNKNKNLDLKVPEKPLLLIKNVKQNKSTSNSKTSTTSTKNISNTSDVNIIIVSNNHTISVSDVQAINSHRKRGKNKGKNTKNGKKKFTAKQEFVTKNQRENGRKRKPRKTTPSFKSSSTVTQNLKNPSTKINFQTTKDSFINNFNYVKVATKLQQSKNGTTKHKYKWWTTPINNDKNAITNFDYKRKPDKNKPNIPTANNNNPFDYTKNTKNIGDSITTKKNSKAKYPTILPTMGMNPTYPYSTTYNPSQSISVFEDSNLPSSSFRYTNEYETNPSPSWMETSYPESFSTTPEKMSTGDYFPPASPTYDSMESTYYYHSTVPSDENSDYYSSYPQSGTIDYYSSTPNMMDSEYSQHSWLTTTAESVLTSDNSLSGSSSWTTDNAPSDDEYEDSPTTIKIPDILLMQSNNLPILSTINSNSDTTYFTTSFSSSSFPGDVSQFTIGQTTNPDDEEGYGDEESSNDNGNSDKRSSFSPQSSTANPDGGDEYSEDSSDGPTTDMSTTSSDDAGTDTTASKDESYTDEESSASNADDGEGDAASPVSKLRARTRTRTRGRGRTRAIGKATTAD